MSEQTLYERLGGYDGITGFVENLLPRLKADSLLGRFWEHRGDDGVDREKQLLIDYLCSNAGGPTYYTGRDMKLLHKGMMISEKDWSVFFEHAGAAMEELSVPQQERDDVVAFVSSLQGDIVEA
jgi:hemoglobin